MMAGDMKSPGSMSVTIKTLLMLIKQRRFDEAEALAVDFIAQDTDRAGSWTSIPAIEFYLRERF
jgi:hypothetical protein